MKNRSQALCTTTVMGSSLGGVEAPCAQFNPSSRLLIKLIDVCNISPSRNSKETDEVFFKRDSTHSTYLPESETLAQIFKLKTGGVQRANPWRDLPTIASYIDMDGLENDDRAEESILRAMRNQGW